MGSECAICLISMIPTLALFYAPCGHSWHYKCIRPLIVSGYPHFPCPNCRHIADLEADIEDDPNIEEEWENSPEELEQTVGPSNLRNPIKDSRAVALNNNSNDSLQASASSFNGIAVDEMQGVEHGNLNAEASDGNELSRQATMNASGISGDRSQSPEGQSERADGVLTPTNYAGPFIFDGSHSRPRQ